MIYSVETRFNASPGNFIHRLTAHFRFVTTGSFPVKNPARVMVEAVEGEYLTRMKGESPQALLADLNCSNCEGKARDYLENLIETDFSEFRAMIARMSRLDAATTGAFLQRKSVMEKIRRAEGH